MLRINVSKFDNEAMGAISRLPSYLHPFFKLLSYIGHPITISGIDIVIASYGIIQQKSALFFSGALIGITLLISTALKRTIKRPRPVTDYVRAMRIHSSSFPSGHTAGSTAAFGLLAYYTLFLVQQPLSNILVALLALLILFVGISRVYLGAHYPTDVIGGWILGGMVLYIIIFLIEPLA